MSVVDTRVFRQISTIIERDVKNTSYKFALLRGTIDIIQQYSHFAESSKGEVIFPVGLLVERWLLYYYPFIRESIPQQVGEVPERDYGGLAFRTDFKAVVSFYEKTTKYDGFFRDIANRDFPNPIQKEMMKLIRAIATTIKKNPMQYIGNSLNEGTKYSIYRVVSNVGSLKPVIGETDVFASDSYGKFAISEDVFEVFRFMGSFISGKANLLFKWAEFTARLQKDKHDVNGILNDLLYVPDATRDVALAKGIFIGAGMPLVCTWTNRPIRNLNIDHVIPYSLWYNNDLWNLLPTQANVNSQKSDSIPHPATVLHSGANISRYWNLLRAKEESLFLRQMRKALTGNLYGPNWQIDAIKKLAQVCDNLISIRGLTPWQP